MNPRGVFVACWLGAAALAAVAVAAGVYVVEQIEQAMREAAE